MVLYLLLPSRGKSVNQCWRKMAASPTERSWCVLELARCNIFVAGQRDFRRKFGRRGHYETANIPFSNGSNIMYICSVFVKMWFCKLLRQFIRTLYNFNLSTRVLSLSKGPKPKTVHSSILTDLFRHRHNTIYVLFYSYTKDDMFRCSKNHHQVETCRLWRIRHDILCCVCDEINHYFIVEHNVMATIKHPTHLHLVSRVKNEWSYTPTPHMRLYGVDRDNFTFILPIRFSA
jgi:hypothetical protein